MNPHPAPAPLAEHRCPLCGQANDCAVARSGSFDQPCWCTSIQISPEALARIPEDQRGKACVCRACAEKNASTAAKPGP